VDFQHQFTKSVVSKKDRAASHARQAPSFPLLARIARVMSQLHTRLNVHHCTDVIRGV
jgi:hypothetical protein